MSNFDSKAYSLYLQTHIKPWARPASGGRVINCRCFYCADSKNRNHGHFYISIPQDTSTPSLFYCQKCGARGIVTADKLTNWQVYDSNMAISLTNFNNMVLSLPQNRKYRAINRYMIRNTQVSDDRVTQAKVKYLNDRLGLNLSIADYQYINIVFNLSDIMKENKLKPTRDQRIVDQLDTNFLGFLSFDRSVLNLRNVGIVENNKLHPSLNKRYVNYNLLDNYDNTIRFYTLPASIDLLNPYPIELHIAEGPMDILSIYYNLRQQNARGIFSASMGKGYKAILRHFIPYISSPNVIIHIYPDNDMDRDHILDIHDYVEPFKYPFYIHRNVYEGEKDFGVPINRIQESVERVM